MRIDTVSNNRFSSNAAKVNKLVKLKINNKKFIGIKPIKNYAQYMKEYGLKNK